jgi:hypothetical protein
VTTSRRRAVVALALFVTCSSAVQELMQRSPELKALLRL